LRDAIGDLEQDLIDHETDVSNPHNVTHAQTGPEAADPTKTTTSRHKHVSDADLKQVYDTKSDLAAHENDDENPHLVTHAQTGPEGATSGTDTAKNKHVSNADYKRWEDHLANKSNPHAVTAAQVGAAPASHTHTASQVGLGNVQNYGIATKAQAEAGTANDVYMTPLRVKEAITALAPLVPLQAVTSDPSSPAVGRIWLRTDLV
jgi:hypothetical protein